MYVQYSKRDKLSPNNRRLDSEKVGKAEEAQVALCKCIFWS